MSGVAVPFIPGFILQIGQEQHVPVILTGPTWADNTDGTATITLTTDIACYAGADYGSAAGIYTKSSFDYDGAGPALALGTSHTIEIPDPLAGGLEPADTYYYRIFAALSGSPAGQYIDIERTGNITDTTPILSAAIDGTPTLDGCTGAGVDTDEGNGVLYWAVVTNGGSCTAAQLKAGTGGNIVAGAVGNQVVSAIGSQTISDITGLSAATIYQIKFLQRDAGGNDSAQASVDLTTLAPAIGLEGSADFLLQENGDYLLVESGASADISAFSAAAALDGTEEWVFVQGGMTVKVTTNQLKTYVNA